MKKFRLTFNDGPMGNRRVSKDILAEDFDDAAIVARKMPEAYIKEFRDNDVVIEEIVDGPKVIGICYNYYDHSCKRTYQGYTFIRALDEAQAIDYYNKNIKSKVFYQPWPDKFDENGNCEYGAVAYTYFAGGDGYSYDAIEDNKKKGDKK